jgi:hypothetical protein
MLKSFKKFKVFFVFALLLILSLLLAACGPEQLPNANDGKYEIPVYNGGENLAAVAANTTLRGVMLNPELYNPSIKPNDFVEKNLQVYALPATTQLNTVKDYYNAEMRKLGWLNYSVNLTAANALGSDGIVEGFTKQNHVTGIYLVAPNAIQKGALKGIGVPSDRVILIISSATRLAQ